jgi:hypothetical protein
MGVTILSPTPPLREFLSGFDPFSE